MSSVYYVNSLDRNINNPVVDDHFWYLSYAEEEAMFEAELAAYKELI